MNRKTFENYMSEYAETVTQKPNRYKHKRSTHVAMLVHDGRILHYGVNMNLYSDFVDKYNPLKCLHAETVAVLKALKRDARKLSECEMWVTRTIGPDMYSKPCKMCSAMLRKYKIKVRYTDEKGNWL